MTINNVKEIKNNNLGADKRENKTTIKEAVRKWVNEFNGVEQTLISESMKNNIDNWYELQTYQKGDYITYKENWEEYEVMEIKGDTLTIIIDGEEVEINKDEAEKEQDSLLPIWGTMWTFGEGIDEDWARENIDIMGKCGFRVYEYQETGTLYFGIDGAGYDFYEQHWIPLYKARGLKWHGIEE